MGSLAGRAHWIEARRGLGQVAHYAAIDPKKLQR